MSTIVLLDTYVIVAFIKYRFGIGRFYCRYYAGRVYMVNVDYSVNGRIGVHVHVLIAIAEH